jgi:hypothetical protein
LEAASNFEHLLLINVHQMNHGEERAGSDGCSVQDEIAYPTNLQHLFGKLLIAILQVLELWIWIIIILQYDEVVDGSP